MISSFLGLACSPLELPDARSRWVQATFALFLRRITVYIQYILTVMKLWYLPAGPTVWRPQSPRLGTASHRVALLHRARDPEFHRSCEAAPFHSPPHTPFRPRSRLVYLLNSIASGAFVPIFPAAESRPHRAISRGLALSRDEQITEPFSDEAGRLISDPSLKTLKRSPPAPTMPASQSLNGADGRRGRKLSSIARLWRVSSRFRKAVVWLADVG